MIFSAYHLEVIVFEILQRSMPPKCLIQLEGKLRCSLQFYMSFQCGSTLERKTVFLKE